MIIAFPCAIGYMVIGQGLIRMLFPSSDYITGGKLMLAGSAAIIFYAISNVTGGALQSIDKCVCRSFIRPFRLSFTSAS